MDFCRWWRVYVTQKMSKAFFHHLPTSHATMFRLEAGDNRLYVWQSGGRGGPHHFDLFIPCYVEIAAGVPLPSRAGAPGGISVYNKSAENDLPCILRLTERRVRDLDDAI